MASNKIPSLSNKLYSTFIISFILPILLICIFISYRFSTYLHQELLDQTTNNIQLISTYLTKYISDIDNIMRSPYSLPYLRSKISLEDLSSYEKNALSSDIGSTLMMTTYSRHDFGDLLFLSEEEVLYFNAENYYKYLPTNSPLSSRNWYTEAINKNGKIAIVPYNQTAGSDKKISTESFYISRKLNNLYNPKQENIILLNIKADALNTLFSELSDTTSSIIVFTNDKDEIIYSNIAISPELIDYLDQDKIPYENSIWVHQARNLEKYPLTAHVLFSTSYIKKQNTAFILVSTVCFIIGLIISYLLFHRNNKRIESPVLHIQSILKKIENGDLNARCNHLSVREFDTIGISINGMAYQLQEKIKNEYEFTISQKNLEFQALQSQIQPHFIINTIYNFISLNQIGEHELLNDAFYSFAHLLRYVLNQENNVTIEKELDFLDSYCSLYRLRFGHRISYNISCDEHLRSFPLPKLILQPLVENAVIHGIEPSEVPCTLNISVEEHNNTIYIIIEDNGVGFTAEQLHSPDSIGIKNVENRIAIWNENIKLYFYRVDNQSIQTIIIPKLPQGEK